MPCMSAAWGSCSVQPCVQCGMQLVLPCCLQFQGSCRGLYGSYVGVVSSFLQGTPSVCAMSDGVQEYSQASDHPQQLQWLSLRQAPVRFGVFCLSCLSTGGVCNRGPSEAGGWPSFHLCLCMAAWWKSRCVSGPAVRWTHGWLSYSATIVGLVGPGPKVGCFSSQVGCWCGEPCCGSATSVPDKERDSG